ncbi:Nitric oxide-responding transcriptional regulator Dnr (Crp/Fnr family) [hydrothermal vent metagenome]|uniref:Nitric oxide-responding transcriptional regulator Dnr (Crp/Fnr family) n=1 Tax=hydrothermal vent metagenome TaxID=652676 RepID=A0A1W1ELJ0_9ZZZZ
MNYILKKVIVVIALLLATNSYGANNDYDKIKLIDIAGKQRMLSQTIAKDYFYIGKKVGKSKANRELTKSLTEFNKIAKTLSKSINNPEIINLLEFIKMSNEDFQAVIKTKFNLNDGQLVLDYSESILEGTQYLIDSLQENIKKKESKIVAEAGRQRVLAQRIAKYYISYQSGIKDKNTIEQMKQAVKDFASIHKSLMANKQNTPQINRKLNEVNRLWSIVYKFYLKIERGRLPYIVFITTNDISKKMDEVTKLYLELYK